MCDTNSLTTIEEQLDYLLSELENGTGSTKDKVQYAITVTKNVLVYIDSLFPQDEIKEFHLDEPDCEHVNEGFC